MTFITFSIILCVFKQYAFSHSQGDIRIVSGRLEVYHSGEWGTVCDDGFNDTEAKVACRQLGYSFGYAIGNVVADGSGQIWLDDLNCKGTESKLSYCDHGGWGKENCGHGEDVGIMCDNSVDGNWGLWSSWTQCAHTCGGGTKRRQRQCDNPRPAYRGQKCCGNSTESALCNTKSCPENGNWSSWSNWTECSELCEGGLQERSRSCSNPSPVNGGVFCEGISKEVILCNKFECPENRYKYTGAALGGVAVGCILLTTAIILIGQYFFPKLRTMHGAGSCLTWRRTSELYENNRMPENLPTQSYDNVAYASDGNLPIEVTTNTRISENRTNQPRNVCPQENYENTVI